MVKLIIIPFNQNHINPVWIWRNDIQTIEMSLSKKNVAWQEHFEWCNSIIKANQTICMLLKNLEFQLEL